MAESVNHPSHYTQTDFECIELVRYMGFNLGNAIKYIWRYDSKNGIEDLKKALWYLDDELKHSGQDQRATLELKERLKAATDSLDSHFKSHCVYWITISSFTMDKKQKQGYLLNAMESINQKINAL